MIPTVDTVVQNFVREISAETTKYIADAFGDDDFVGKGPDYKAGYERGFREATAAMSQVLINVLARRAVTP